jgi:hypothetical protein
MEELAGAVETITAEKNVNKDMVFLCFQTVKASSML